MLWDGHRLERKPKFLASRGLVQEPGEGLYRVLASERTFSNHLQFCAALIRVLRESPSLLTVTCQHLSEGGKAS